MAFLFYIYATKTNSNQMKKQLLTLLLMLSAVFAFGQVTTSNIKGLILDESNEPLPGANVVAVHIPTGTRYGAATNYDGRYNLLNLRVGGPYTVTITFVGYKEQVLDNIFLNLGKTENIDVKMIAESEQLETGSYSGHYRYWNFWK